MSHINNINNKDMQAWLEELSDKIMSWLLSLRVPAHPGQFRFCREGATFHPGPRAGLGISCLALKICIMLGRLSVIQKDELDGWLEHVRSFQTSAGRTMGYFEDLQLLRVLDKRKGWFRLDWEIRRAETRQACASLLGAGAKPCFAISHVPRTPKEAVAYVRRLDWKEPWGAGSHVSHLLFFLKLNADFFHETSVRDELEPAILKELDSLHDPDSGSWFKGKPSMEQIINGAMKLITGYTIIGKPFRYPEKLIDTCLTAINDEHGCNHADIIYVLYQCSRMTSYRHQEIIDFARRRLDMIHPFHRTDGGFSFFPDKAQTNYYGVTMSKGLSESDVHGTTLFVWTLTMIGEILGFNSEYGWKVPIT
jgi:hypothetical protein